MTQFSNTYDFIIFSGKSNLDLAKKIAKSLGVKLGRIDIGKFADGETYVNVREDVKDKNVIVMQSGSKFANENLIELLIILDAVKQLFPRKIIACLPFYPYRRQEKKIEKGESITAELVARLIETAGADEVLLLDLHSEIIKKFFKIKVRETSAFNVFAEYFRNKLRAKSRSFVVVAPDRGAIGKNKNLASVLGADFAYISKTRARKHDIVEGMKIYGDVSGKNVIILDDEISTGGTLIKAANLLKKFAACDIFIAVTHGVLADSAVKKLNKAPIKEIIITDSVYLTHEKRIKKIKVLSVAKILAKEIKKYG